MTMTEPKVATVKTGGATSGQTGTLAAMIDGEVLPLQLPPRPVRDRLGRDTMPG
jgi:hypothetical protein